MYCVPCCDSFIGLVIEVARYGDLNTAKIIDVRIPLQSLVYSSQLHLHEQSKVILMLTIMAVVVAVFLWQTSMCILGILARFLRSMYWTGKEA